MLKLLGVVVTAVVAVTMLASCGGEDGGSDLPTAVTAPAPEVPEQPTGTLEMAALAEVADANCAFSDQLSARLGPRGKTLSGAQAETAGSIPGLEEVQTLQAALDPAEPVASDWDEYLKASQGLIDSGVAVADASDDAEAQKAIAALEKARQKTYPPADALGLETCTYTPAATVAETEMNDPATFDLAVPTNTVEQAAKDFIAAVDSGDCEKINAQRNSDAGELSADTCQYLITGYSGLELIGSESYGPAALAQFASKEDATRQGTVQFVIDLDGKLKYVNESVISGGGIHPPSEGFDAQETIDFVLESIRNEDEAAFAGTLGPDGAYAETEDPLTEFSTEPSGKIFTEAVRENADAEAVMIGANQALAYFILDMDDQDFLLEIGHSPGSETEYRNPGYWALPSASG